MKNAPQILVRDMLRAQVEKQSDGRVTVLYDDRDMPSFMLVIHKFRCEDVDSCLGTGVHPAFFDGKTEHDELFIGQYPATEIDGLAYSLPERQERTSIDFDDARKICAGKGKGWHLLTSWEWAALLVHVAKTGGKEFVKSYWEWNDGLKLEDGKLFFPDCNNYDLPEAEWPHQGCGFDDADGTPVLTREVTRFSEDPKKDIDIGDYASLGNIRELTYTGYIPEEKKQLLERMMIAARAGSVFSEVDGGLWVRNYGVRPPIRGGDWSDGAYTGLASLDLGCARSDSYYVLGLRPAFLST